MGCKSSKTRGDREEVVVNSSFTTSRGEGGNGMQVAQRSGGGAGEKTTSKNTMMLMDLYEEDFPMMAQQTGPSASSRPSSARSAPQTPHPPYRTPSGNLSFMSNPSTSKEFEDVPITPKTPRAAPSSCSSPRNNQRIVILKSEVLGRGGYGTVYRAYDKKTKEPMAVKEVNFDAQNLSLMQNLRSEFNLLSQLQHANIVRVFHFSIDLDQHRARIFMELMPSGSVRAMGKKLPGRIFTEAGARRIMYQALLGLEYLHSKGIIHRDIKPDNMLIDGEGIVKLSDFGTCKTTIHAASGTTTAVVGTVAYMSPESITGKYSQGTDTWALAATMVELLSGQTPWSELHMTQNVHLLFHIGSAKPPNHFPQLPRGISPELTALLTECFAYEPRSRPTAMDLLCSSYFDQESFLDDHLSEESGQTHPSFESISPRNEFFEET